MKMIALPSLLLLPALAGMPAVALAQASGEAADMGPGNGASAALVAEPAARSPLWLAIEAAHRQRDGSAPGPDRRLTPQQRQQLREQIRNAALLPEREPAGATPIDPR